MKQLFALFFCAMLGACSSSGPVTFSTPQLPPPGGFPNIFKRYSREGDSEMMAGWVRNFDFSGVSFDQRMTCTLVTKRHVVMANHYRRLPGQKVIFHDRYGKRLERSIVALEHVMGDVAVGLLDQEVTTGYRVYPLPVPREDFSDLHMRYAVVTDQNRRVFFHQVAHIRNGNHVSLRHEKPKRHGWGKQLIKGDSGNPTFMISGGSLVLMETHSTGGSGGGPFYGGADLQEKLQAKIDELAPGYRLRRKAL